MNNNISASINFPSTNLSSSLNLADRFKSDEELHTLKKIMRQKEADFKKENALLQ